MCSTPINIIFLILVRSFSNLGYNKQPFKPSFNFVKKLKSFSVFTIFYDKYDHDYIMILYEFLGLSINSKCTVIIVYCHDHDYMTMLSEFLCLSINRRCTLITSYCRFSQSYYFNSRRRTNTTYKDVILRVISCL